MTRVEQWRSNQELSRFYRTMGDTIRYLRNSRQMRIKDLSGLVGLSCPVITKVEQGTHRLDAHHLSRFALALRCRVSDLYPAGAISDRRQVV